MQLLENEINKLKEDIKTRKIIEKAKGLLMDKLHMSEEQAYKRLRKQSMDSQTPMKNVASIIIATME